jgi:predicted acylesterase/phospholipase RssA
MNKATECKIGLALSGWRAPAMAFHLGRLAALNQLGALAHASVLSTVSGGGVIDALYTAAMNPSEFEVRLREASYVWGDGARSSVRAAIGVQYEGVSDSRPNFGVVFRAPGLAGVVCVASASCPYARPMADR